VHLSHAPRPVGEERPSERSLEHASHAPRPVGEERPSEPSIVHASDAPRPVGEEPPRERSFAHVLDPTPLQVLDAVIARVVTGGVDPASIHVDRLLSLVAAAQNDTVTHEQLVALGLGRGAIGHRLRRGLLRPLHVGVYLFGHVKPSAVARAQAAVLACGARTLVSHHAIAALIGIRPPVAGDVDVTVIGRKPRPRGVRVHETATLDPADVRRLHGIPATAPARTLLDIAPDLQPRELAAAVEQAQVRCLVTRDEILAALDRAPGRRGSRIRRELASEPVFTRSQAERRLAALLRAAKLPRPDFNTMVEGFEVDALWRPQRVILEFDSYAFHATRAAFERDRRRDAVHSRAKYTTLRTTWRELTRESYVLIARVAEALAVSSR